MNGVVETAIFIRIQEPLSIPLYEAALANIGVLESLAKKNGSDTLEYLEKVANRFSQYETKIQCVVLEGYIADTLVAYAEDNKIDLILIATHGRSGIGRWLMGSVAERIIQYSHVPVLMVNATTFVNQ